MSTKAQIQAKINQITTGGLNTAVEAVEVWQIIADELFSPIVSNSKTTTSLTPQSISSTTHTWLNYNINVKKEGNVVKITGWLENKSSSLQTGFTALTFSDSQYNARTGLDTVAPAPANDDSVIQVSYSGTGIYVISTMIPNTTYRINHFYYTND